MSDPIVPAESTGAEDLARRQASGLRALADMIEQNPEVAPLARYNLSTLAVFSSRDPEHHALLARLALRYGAKVDKRIADDLYNLDLAFADGAVVARAIAWRSEVCERVVIGTETVTKQVPDPTYIDAAPMVEVTEDVEKVEWVCRPLLAAESVSS